MIFTNIEIGGEFTSIVKKNVFSTLSYERNISSLFNIFKISSLSFSSVIFDNNICASFILFPKYLAPLDKTTLNILSPLVRTLSTFIVLDNFILENSEILPLRFLYISYFVI